MAKVQKRVVDDGLGRPSLRGRVSESGRLSLPAEVRREVGLEKGGPVRIDLVDGSIRIRTMSEIKDRIQAMARDSGLTEKASVAGFLSRRADERTSEAKGVKAKGAKG
jgi:bifunctional DNA-binding transcriptional regulator/antitoxin component of YhaV-PrlF toxin-antitoxin module